MAIPKEGGLLYDTTRFFLIRMVLDEDGTAKDSIRVNSMFNAERRKKQSVFLPCDVKDMLLLNFFLSTVNSLKVTIKT